MTPKQQGALNVKYPRLMAASAAVVSLVLGSQALGQPAPAARPAAQARPTSIGLINMAYIFEHHPRLKEMKGELKADVERADAAVKAEQENIKKLAEKFEQFRRSPEGKTIEEDVARRSSELKLKIAMQRKEFMLREARMYHQTYVEIGEVVKYHCEQNGIDVVLRFNAEPVDVENPESVLMKVNNQIVHYAPNLDVTGAVLSTIYRQYGIDPANPTREAGRTVPGPSAAVQTARIVSRRSCAVFRPPKDRAAGRQQGQPFVTDDWHLGMYATRKQRTIAAPAVVSGVGYWSGRDVRVEFRPAAADTGIVFVRGDLPGCPRIAATVEHRIETPRRTTLRCGEAARRDGRARHGRAGRPADRQLRGLGRSAGNARLRRLVPAVRRGPAGRGRRRAGRRRAARAGRPPRASAWATTRVGSRPGPCRSGKTVLRYELDYGSGNPIGRQSLEISLSPRHFHINLAPSRTFMLEAEADGACRPRGWASGPRCKDLLVFGSRRADRQRTAFSRRVRAPQAGRHGRRPGPGRLRSGRPLRRLPQRPPAERRTGPRDRRQDEVPAAQTARRCA